MELSKADYEKWMTADPAELVKYSKAELADIINQLAFELYKMDEMFEAETSKNNPTP